MHVLVNFSPPPPPPLQLLVAEIRTHPLREGETALWGRAALFLVLHHITTVRSLAIRSSIVYTIEKPIEASRLLRAVETCGSMT